MPTRSWHPFADMRASGGSNGADTAAKLARRYEVVAEALRRQGILAGVPRGVALQVSPPFVITEDEICLLVDGFEAALAEIAGA